MTTEAEYSERGRITVERAKALAQNLTVATQRLWWGLNYLQGKRWLSDAERSAVTSAIRLGALLFPAPPPYLAYRFWADETHHPQLAGALHGIVARGEEAQFRVWYASSREIARLVFDQRSVELDAQIAARKAEWDAIWDKTIEDVKDVLRDVGDAAGDLISWAIPDWLIPVGLAIGALVLVGRSGSNGKGSG